MKLSRQSILNFTDGYLLPQRSEKCRLELVSVTTRIELQACCVGWAGYESPAVDSGTESSDLAALPLILYLCNQISSLQI